MFSAWYVKLYRNITELWWVKGWNACVLAVRLACLYLLFFTWKVCLWINVALVCSAYLNSKCLQALLCLNEDDDDYAYCAHFHYCIRMKRPRKASFAHSSGQEISCFALHSICHANGCFDEQDHATCKSTKLRGGEGLPIMRTPPLSIDHSFTTFCFNLLAMAEWQSFSKPPWWSCQVDPCSCLF